MDQEIALREWGRRYCVIEFIDILKKNGFDNILAAALMGDEDIKCFKLSHGASKKLSFACQQANIKLQNLLKQGGSASRLHSLYTPPKEMPFQIGTAAQSPEENDVPRSKEKMKPNGALRRGRSFGNFEDCTTCGKVEFTESSPNLPPNSPANQQISNYYGMALVPSAVNESPGCVHYEGGYCLCINTNTLGVNIFSENGRSTTSFMVHSGAKGIQITLMNSSQKAPRGYTIFSFVSPTGKTYPAQPYGQHNGYISFPHMTQANSVVAVSVSGSIMELGLWTVYVDTTAFVDVMTNDSSVTKSSISEDIDSLWINCSVLCEINFETQGNAIYNLCMLNRYTKGYFTVFGFPTQTPNRELDMCEKCIVQVIVVAVTVFTCAWFFTGWLAGSAALLVVSARTLGRILTLEIAMLFIQYAISAGDIQVLPFCKQICKLMDKCFFE